MAGSGGVQHHKQRKICQAANLPQEADMNWTDEVNIRLKRKNQVLFAKDSEYLQGLALLFQRQDHKTLALWAFDFAAESVAALEEKYPWEKRPREALEAARGWAAGNIRMRAAQPSDRPARLSIRPDTRWAIRFMI